MIHRIPMGLGRASWGAGLAALSILAGACSTSTPAAGNAWVGSWLCSDERSSGDASDGGASDGGANTDLARFMMEVSTTTTADEIMAVETVDGGSVCSLRFATSSGTASLATGQTCLTASGATMNYTMGTATIQGGSLVVNFAFDLPSASTSGTEAMSCQRYYNSGPVSGGGW